MEESTKLALLRMATDLTVASIQTDRRGVMHTQDAGPLAKVFENWSAAVQTQFAKLGTE